MSSARITAGERDFNMVYPFSDLEQLRSENGNFCRGISRFDAFHEPERYFEHEAHCFLSLEIYRLFYATTKETMAGTRPQVVDSIVTGFIFLLFPSHFFFRLPRWADTTAILETVLTWALSHVSQTVTQHPCNYQRASWVIASPLNANTIDKCNRLKSKRVYTMILYTIIIFAICYKATAKLASTANMSSTTNWIICI